MNLLDWSVIVIYLCVIIVIALRLNRRQSSLRAYFLADQKIKWWQSGVSVMATQLGAISFVSVPAFVVLKPGGGLKWLCYEFGLPLGLLIVVVFLIPVLHRAGVISIYEYLEHRFDRRVRLFISALFLLGRGLATSVAVLAGGLILSTCLGVSTTTAILLVGVITILYDALGGMRIVVLSDVFQMVLIVAGFAVCIWVGLSIVDYGDLSRALSPERARIFDFASLGFSRESEYAFWPMLLGGIFLYASYYGCDQSQMQRQLSLADGTDAKKSILFNAYGRFPLVLLYCFLGVVVGAVAAQPEFMIRVSRVLNTNHETAQHLLAKDPDRLLPLFILSYLPHGVIGFIFVSIMSALMSSLDSALNSLSAVTVRDFYQKFTGLKTAGKNDLVVSKVCTLLWGGFCVSTAILFLNIEGASRQTTLVLINAVGSVLYGPVLAAFLLGILVRRVTAKTVILSVAAGVICNVGLWRFTDISWLWWNFTGFVVPCITAFIGCGLRISSAQNRKGLFSCKNTGLARAVDGTQAHRMVIAYVLCMIFVCLVIEKILTGA